MQRAECLAALRGLCYDSAPEAERTPRADEQLSGRARRSSPRSGRRQPEPTAPRQTRPAAVIHNRRRGHVAVMNQEQIWSVVQEELRFQLAKPSYETWLKNTSLVS